MRKLLGSALCLAAALCTTSAHAGYTSTQHPIVLVHGIAGFDTIGGLINYFHKVPYNLERSGAEVIPTDVSFLNNSEERGRQLKDFIVGLNLGNGEKVNLFAHSQGAPTSRVAASLIPDKIASITSINGVNYGSKVADVVRGILPPGSWVEGGANAIANAVGGIVDELTDGGHPQDGVEALNTLTSDGTYKLNKALGYKGVSSTDNCNNHNFSSPEINYGNGNIINMYSIGGKTMWTNALDPLDALFVVSSKAFNPGEDNDGMVASCSQQMGKVINTKYLLNHGDAVNHLLGVHHVFQEPITLYRKQANRLQNAGL